MKFSGKNGFADVRLIGMVLAAAVAVSVVMSCNSWVRKRNLERQGYIEAPEDQGSAVEDQR